MKKAVLILLTSILFFALVAFNYSSNKESKSHSVKVSTINNSMFEFDILNKPVLNQITRNRHQNHRQSSHCHLHLN